MVSWVCVYFTGTAINVETQLFAQYNVLPSFIPPLQIATTSATITADITTALITTKYSCG